MEHADSFLGLMQSAVGLAGFTAVVLVLRFQQPKPGRRTIFAVRGALANSMVVVIGCAIALGVSAAGVDGSAQWRTSSAIYFVPSLIIAVFIMRDTIRAVRAGIPLWQAVGLWSGSGIAFLLHLSNVVGFPGDPSFGRYYLACIVLLFLAAVQFFVLALGLLRPPAE